MNQTVIIVIVIWMAISAAFSYYATTKDQPAAKWFFMAFCLSPVIAFAMLQKDTDHA